jgi:hypothetical protein
VASPFGPAVLLAYRAAALATVVCVGAAQLATRGPACLAFYTVWSWWLLGAFFAVAGAASLLAVVVRGPSPPRRSAALAPLGAAAVALFHVALPSSLIVVVVTWVVLFPMLVNSPDAKVATRAREIFLNPTSYAQHGGNALLALGDLALNTIPASPYLMAGLGAYSSTFAVWAFAFWRATGRWLYPFLNAHKRWAPAAYAGLYIAHWVFFGVAMLLFKARDRAVAALGGGGKGKAA